MKLVARSDEARKAYFEGFNAALDMAAAVADSEKLRSSIMPKEYVIAEKIRALKQAIEKV